MTNKHVVVVGAGLGGLHTVEELRRVGFDGRITLIGDEVHPPYDRPPLSKQVLAGDWDRDKITLAGEERLAELDVELLLGNKATRLDGTSVTLANGAAVTGSDVVLALGVQARRLPNQPARAHTLRTIDDSLALGTALRDGASLAIIGAGFVGGEVAGIAASMGCHVTVIEQQAVPLARILGPEVGAMCGRLMTEGGVDLRTGVIVAEFRDRSVLLSDGTEVPADEILVGIGGVPHLEWLDPTGIDTSGGIACDSAGRVIGLSNVWAVGDAAAWYDTTSGLRLRHEHWSSATAQAVAVARQIAGCEPPTPAAPYFWSDQFGVKIQLFGHVERATRIAALHGEGLDGGALKGTVIGYYNDLDELVAVAGFSAIKLLTPYKAQLNRVERDRARPVSPTLLSTRRN